MNTQTDNYPTLAERRDLCATPITLNGQPGRITGSGLPYANVVDLATGLRCEFAWPTVARIVANGGTFTS